MASWTLAEYFIYIIHPDNKLLILILIILVGVSLQFVIYLVV